MVDISSWAERWAEEAVQRWRPPPVASQEVVEISEKFTEVLWKALDVTVEKPADAALATAHADRITDDVLAAWRLQKKREAAFPAVKIELQKAFVASARAGILEGALACARAEHAPPSPRPSEVLCSDLSDDDLSDTEEFIGGAMENVFREYAFQKGSHRSLLLEKEMKGKDELATLASPLTTERSSSSAVRNIFGKALADLDDRAFGSVPAAQSETRDIELSVSAPPRRKKQGGVPALDVDDDGFTASFFKLDTMAESPKSPKKVKQDTSVPTADSVVSTELPEPGKGSRPVVAKEEKPQERTSPTRNPPQIKQLKSLKEFGVQVDLSAVPSPVSDAERLSPSKQATWSSMATTAEPSATSSDIKLFSSAASTTGMSSVLDSSAGFETGQFGTGSNLEPAFEEAAKEEQTQEPPRKPERQPPVGLVGGSSSSSPNKQPPVERPGDSATISPKREPPKENVNPQDVRQKARSSLQKGVDEGELQSLLGASEEKEDTAIEQPRELKVNPQDVRQKARSSLQKGAEDGELQKMLGPEQPRPVTPEDVRQKARSSLRKGVEEGELQKMIETPGADSDTRLQKEEVELEFFEKARGGIRKGAEEGELQKMIGAPELKENDPSVQALREKVDELPSNRPITPEDVLQKARSSLRKGVEEGELPKMLGAPGAAPAAEATTVQQSKENVDPSAVRKKARSSLEKGIAEGELPKMLGAPELKESDPSVQALREKVDELPSKVNPQDVRQKARSSLQKGVEEGELPKMLGATEAAPAAAATTVQQSKENVDPSAVRKKARSSLEKGIQEGDLSGLLDQPLDANSLTVKKLESKVNAQAAQQSDINAVREKARSSLQKGVERDVLEDFLQQETQDEEFLQEEDFLASRSATPQVGESGTLRQSEPSAIDIHQLVRTVETLQERIHEREAQGALVEQELAEAYRLANEYQHDAVQAQQQHQQLLAQPDNEKSEAVREFLEAREEKIQRLAGELQEVRDAAQHYEQIAESRQSLLRSLEAEVATTRMNAAFRKHSCGEVFLPTVEGADRPEISESPGWPSKPDAAQKEQMKQQRALQNAEMQHWFVPSSNSADDAEMDFGQRPTEEEQPQRETKELMGMQMLPLDEARDKYRKHVLEMRLDVISQVLSPLASRIKSHQDEQKSTAFAALRTTRPAMELRLEAGAEALQNVGERMMLADVLKTRRALGIFQANAAINVTVKNLQANCKSFLAQKQLQKLEEEHRPSLEKAHDIRKRAHFEMCIEVISQLLRPLASRIKSLEEEQKSRAFAAMRTTRPALELRLEAGAEALQCVGERMMIAEVMKARRALCMLQANNAINLTVKHLQATCKKFLAQKKLENLAEIELHKCQVALRATQVCAIVKIQGMVRAWLYKRRKEKKAASTIIGAVCCTVVCQDQVVVVRKRNRAAKSIQKFVRRRAQRIREKDNTAFLCAYVQTLERQRQLLGLREEHEAAVCIQTEIRGVLAVQERRRQVKEKQERERQASEVIVGVAKLSNAQHFLVEARQAEQRRKELEAANILQMSAKTSYCQDHLRRHRCSENLRRIQAVVKLQRWCAHTMNRLRDQIKQRKIEAEIAAQKQREAEEAASKVIQGVVSMATSRIFLQQRQELDQSVAMVQSSCRRYSSQAHLLGLKKVAFGPFTSVFLDAVRLGSKELELKITTLTERRYRSVFARLRGQPEPEYDSALSGGSRVAGVRDLLARKRDIDGDSEAVEMDYVAAGYDLDMQAPGMEQMNDLPIDDGWMDARGARPGSGNLPSVNSNRGWGESIGVGVQTDAINRGMSHSATAPDFHRNYLERGQEKNAMNLTAQHPGYPQDKNVKPPWNAPSGVPLQNLPQAPSKLSKTTSLPSLTSNKNKAKPPAGLGKRAPSYGKKSRRRQDRGRSHSQPRHRGEQGKGGMAYMHSHHHHHYHIFLQAKKSEGGEVEWRPTPNAVEVHD